MRRRRVLVGRRLEDFTRVGVAIDLSLSEKIWYNLITDCRYQFYLDRRRISRRVSDTLYQPPDDIYRPVTSALVFNNQVLEDRSEIYASLP
jgi:hypothetical protein